MWGVIIAVAVSAASVLGATWAVAYYIPRLHQCKDHKQKVKAMALSIALSAVLVAVCMAAITYMVMSEGIKNREEEAQKLEDELRTRESDIEIRELNLNMEYGGKRSEKQIAEMKIIDDKIQTLKRVNVSISNFQRIAELAVLQTDIKRLVYLDSVLDFKKKQGVLSRLPPKTDHVTDKIFMIYEQNLNKAKFGVDLKRVNIEKQGDNYVISGITAKFVGAENIFAEPILAEYRKIEYNKDGIENRIEIKKDPTSLQYLDRAKNEYNKAIQGDASVEEIKYLKDAVVTTAKDFLKVILGPLCNNENWDCIKFSDEELPDSYPLMEYLTNELDENIAQLKALLESNEQLRRDKIRDSTRIDSIENAKRYADNENAETVQENGDEERSKIENMETDETKNETETEAQPW